jgi:cephalosporin hydroxylase
MQESKFRITKESLTKLNEISQTMEGKTFHKHTHILYDIRTKFGPDMITYLEIGSFAGASISLVSSHEYPTNCYSLDLGSPILPEVVERNVNKFKNEKSTFKYIQGNSQNKNIIEFVKNNIKQIDILFIDGDHTKNGVYNDFYNYCDLVSSGGYIAFDDYLDHQFSPEVKGAVDEIVSKLDKNHYEVIGSLDYELLREHTDLKSSNIYLIRKK